MLPWAPNPSPFQFAHTACREMARAKPRRRRPGRSQLWPLVCKFVRRRRDADGAGIRKRSVEFEATVRERWLVGVVGGKTCSREEIVFPGGGRQVRNAPATKIVSPMPGRSCVSEKATTLQREIGMWMTSPCRRGVQESIDDQQRSVELHRHSGSRGQLQD